MICYQMPKNFRQWLCEVSHVGFPFFAKVYLTGMFLAARPS
jgi:hypothetical protein